MIALDTNILIYAHRPESPFHERAKASVKTLVEGPDQWAMPWPCIHEFLAIVTHQRIFVNPSPLGDALRQVALWLASPAVTTIGENGPAYFAVLQSTIERAAVTGPRIHDARIVAICLSNGVTELWSADRDFSRFSADLRIVSPL